MSGKDLKNKPLVEAILEVKWELQKPASGIEVDPHYKILLGRLFDRVVSTYPEHEQLPTATIPDEIVGQVVQHRFRCRADTWPLIQVGPGILTLNDTTGYTWSDFRTRSLAVVDKLFEAHPKPSDLNVDCLQLRFIDAVEFDYASENVFDFLESKMRVSIALPETLFLNSGIQDMPQQFNWRTSFRCERPAGNVIARFATGQKDGKRAVIWETVVESLGDDTPSMPEQFEDWIDTAHSIADGWFFNLIEGELERRFSGE